MLRLQPVLLANFCQQPGCGLFNQIEHTLKPVAPPRSMGPVLQ
jgi:hypothetical protein